jgi:type I restriction enzyme S subunit
MYDKIPNDWSVAKLEALLDYVIGGDWGKDSSFEEKDYVPVLCIRGSEFKNWNEEKGRTASIRKIKVSSLKSRKLELGDILLEISGGGPEQPVGRTVIIDKSVLSFRPELPKVCTNFLRLLRPNKKIDSIFLNYFFELFYGSGEISKYQGGSNNLRNLKFNDFIGILIPLAPLPEQKCIVAKLEQLLTDLDKGTEYLKTAQQQLKTYRQAVLKWAFEGKLTHPDVKDGELPEGWTWKKHSEIAEINPKLPFDKIDDDLEVSFVPMKLVEEEKNKIHLTEFKKYRDVKKGFTSFSNGDIIFAKITPCMENGKCAVVQGLKNSIGFGSTEFHVSRPRNGYNPYYIFYYLIQERFRREASKHFTGSVGQKRVPTSFFSEVLIPIPHVSSEQTKIVLEIESRLSVCDKLEETIANALQQAEALRLSIIKKAFEGRLLSEAERSACRNDPDWEPAHKLLERIKATRNNPEKTTVKTRKNNKKSY